MSDARKVRAGGRDILVSRPGKILFPAAGISKIDLVEYYIGIAPAALPHIEGRPLTMERYPDGLGEEGFYHKEAPDHFPRWIERVRVEVRGEEDGQFQVMANDAAALAYLADQGCITPHVWLSRAGDLERPDRMIFDLDPSGGDFKGVKRGARILRGILDGLGLVPFVMTSGSRGLHVTVPLLREAGFDEVRSFALRVARRAAGEHPDLLTVEQRKKKRMGRILIDCMRNGYGQTSVPPYCVRARKGAPVSVPLEWEELARTGSADRYGMAAVMRRLGQKEDPWKYLSRRARSLAGPSEKLGDRWS